MRHLQEGVVEEAHSFGWGGVLVLVGSLQPPSWWGTVSSMSEVVPPGEDGCASHVAEGTPDRSRGSKKLTATERMKVRRTSLLFVLVVLSGTLCARSRAGLMT